MEINKCQGITKKGNKCNNSALADSKFCIYHKEIIIFNENCPICLNCDDIMHILEPCKHRLHLNCAENMISFDCPLCRKSIDNFPSFISEKINYNITKNRKLIEEEEENNILNILNQNNNSFRKLRAMFMPQAEIYAAVQFLCNNKIPACYIPIEYRISLFENMPSLHEGSIFSAIVSLVFENIIKDVQNEGIDIEEILDENFNEDLAEEDVYNDTDLNIKIMIRFI